MKKRQGKIPMSENKKRETREQEEDDYPSTMSEILHKQSKLNVLRPAPRRTREASHSNQRQATR